MKRNSQQYLHGPRSQDFPELDSPVIDDIHQRSTLRKVHRMNQLANSTTLPLLDSTLMLLRALQPGCPDWHW